LARQLVSVAASLLTKALVPGSPD